VSIVDFIQENMRVLATVNDHNLGGRDFDDVIIEFLCEVRTCRVRGQGEKRRYDMR